MARGFARQPTGILAARDRGAMPARCRTLEDGILEVEAAIGEDVDLDAVEDRHPRKLLAQRLDIVALVRDIVARERPRRGSARRVVGDRDVLVAERMAASTIDSSGVAAIAVGRVHVQVAADVGVSTSGRQAARRRGFDLAGPVTELGGDERQSETRVERLFAGVRRSSRPAAHATRRRARPSPWREQRVEP